MSGKDSKRAKGRRTLFSHPKINSSVHSRIGSYGFGIAGASPKPFQMLGNNIAMNINDVASELGFTLNPSHEDAMRITELMDAPIDLDIPGHAISRGPNPYLDRCMYCNTPRTSSQEGDECLQLIDLQFDDNTVINDTAQSQSYNSLKLEIWTCLSCRKVAGNFHSFLEANCPQSYDLPYLHDSCIDPLTCSHCQEERDNHEKDKHELLDNFIELHSIVKDLYSSKEETLFTQSHGERLQFLIDKLCRRDPHQLFLRLESQVREIVVDIKSNLLGILKEKGIKSPELALDFTSALLCYYDIVTKKSHLLAQYLGGLNEHLCRFKVTWELLNKYLFHSIAHNDSTISSSGPTILEHLRQGSVQYERSKDDPYSCIRKRLLKFQEEMSVVVVVWRDCQQLIESYCQEEVKNTQKQVSSKARSFITQQRQFLKEQLLKDPIVDPEAMKGFLPIHKTSSERVLCHQCKRERCTCDECTITHMITCGIINSNKGDLITSPNSFNFAIDPTRNIIDITPPSMSSTTSSSGSVSPINIEDKLTTFYDCDRVLQKEFKDELSDALLTCKEHEGQVSSDIIDDIDGNAGDDEEDDDDDDDVDDDFTDNQNTFIDEPHAVQILNDLKNAEQLWEVVQQQHYQQHILCDRMNTQHNCAQCHQIKSGQACLFEPKLDSELSRQIDLELAKTTVTSNLLDQVTGDTVNNSNICATCQCHACLNQSGHIISTTLPIQMPVSPSPSELHLYPHIHGLPQHNQQCYMSDLSSQLISSIKLPVKLDFTEGIQDHLLHSYSDWESTLPRPGSLASQHHQQHHQRLSALSASLPPPPPPLVTSASNFTFDYASHLVTHTTNTSTTNTTSAFKSVVGKQISSVLTSPSNLDISTSEGSSVDPTKPLDFASFPQSCLNSSTSTDSLIISCPVSLSLSDTLLPTTPSTLPGAPVTVKSTTACHNNPQCSRPAPLGGNAVPSRWERGHHCKKSPVNSNSVTKQTAAVQVPHQSYNLGVTNNVQVSTSLTPSQVSKHSSPIHHHKEEVIRSFRSSLPCSHSSNTVFRPTPSTSSNAISSVTTGQSVAVSCNNSLSTIVSNIAVGTSTPCNDPECEVHHHDDNCDSVDDSCSEKSSSTSTSNQKEGKYCDCCYCEFFGHNNTQVAKTSTNYIEMKDRLRKKLKKRQSESKHKQVSPKNGIVHETGKEELQEPLEKKDIEALLSFINGKDEDTKVKEKELTAKAAKRARQKQKKLEEKARLEKSSSPSEKDHQIEKNTKHPCLNTSILNQQSKSIRSPEICDRKYILDRSHDSETTQQEMNSSFIIESTRSAINRPQKNLTKTTKPIQSNAENGAQHKHYAVVSSVKQQLMNPLISQLDSTSETKSNGSIPKTENIKSNKQVCNEQHSHKGHGLKQTTRTVNGKVPDNYLMNDHLMTGQKNTLVKKNHFQADNQNGLFDQKTSSSQSVVTISVASTVCQDSPGSGSSTSQSPSCGTKISSEQVKVSCKSKKNKKKNKNGDINGVDEIFMPKSESELDGDVDEFERELEEFKRFCFEPAEPKERRKIAVNVNLKDIFKKKNGMV